MILLHLVHVDSSSSILDTSDTTVNESSTNTEWYKGSKLDVQWLLKMFSILRKIKLGKRSGLKCMICFDQITEAKQFSRNGQVPMADGIRCDGKRELMRVIDHLHSDSHGAACKADEIQRLWLTQSYKHPWIKVLKNHESEIVKNLIEIAIDVHNDSKVLTLSANSWPSRSLSKMHADAQIASYGEYGLDSTFVSFKPSTPALQYKNPIIYREMLDTVAEITMESVTKELKHAECFSIQVDGSVDKYSIDNKFITARYLDKSKAMKNVFLGESHSSKRGAEGLLDSIIITLKNLNLEDIAKQNMTGLTTDGESANTGKNSGLWVRLREYLKKEILCIWCVAHRSDLAFGDLQASVVEVKHWKSNLKAVATFYRSSAVRTEELKLISEKSNNKFYRFPEYFEVRFVQHLINLSKSVWNNLKAIRMHWNSIITSDGGNKSEKSTAKGFLKLWKEGGDQEYYTALMMDILRQFEKLQKQGQKSMTTLCDVETTKTEVLESLTLIKSNCFPGGKEEDLKNKIYNITELENEKDDDNIQTRTIRNSYVSTRRYVSSVKNEIILSAIEFLQQRLEYEQKSIIDRLKSFLNSQSAIEMISSVRCDVEGLFDKTNLSQFSDEVLGLYAAENLPAPRNITDFTGKLYYYLKISTPNTLFSKLVQTYISITPHSCGPERAVSCHTILKTNKQSNYSREAINSHLYIALNSSGTAHFDPRPSVARFLQKKQRRYKLPDEQAYKDHFYIKKFFEEV
ncbi:hypothetical protein AGLY_012738 [Aphis glycines]|uniref:DUF4371 domain-containing protein n=1 Tax=Aphis glycines TaxID=307491 RepID=A0A6G0TAN2_APHGL|nr:hypothetical protein AGLY_012738 [Aphis glycines]